MYDTHKLLLKQSDCWNHVCREIHYSSRILKIYIHIFLVVYI